MKHPQEQLIVRDYLKRKRAYFIGGALVHLVAIIIACFSNHTTLIGVIGGSAFVLAIELIRGGGSGMARTLLSLPVTKKQLARSWRFVALELPIVLNFCVLIIGVVVGTLFGGSHMTVERFLIIALLQTGMLGTAFFALTGMQTAPIANVDLAQRARDTFFAIVWGFSIPALLFLSNLSPTSFGDLNAGQFLAGIFLLVATVAGWFRGEALVARRVSRSAIGNSKLSSKPSRSEAPATSWQGFGGLRYFFIFFGRRLVLIFGMMLLVMWGVLEIFMQVGTSGARESGGGAIGNGQAGMFIAMIGMMAIFQVIPSLRVLRTLPVRLTTIASCLIFGPLVLTSTIALLVFVGGSIFSGGAFDPGGYLVATLSASMLLLGLPLILRYGIRLKTLLPLMILVTAAQVTPLFSQEFFKGNLTAYWIAISAGIIAVAAIAWFLTYRTLRSPHPWRGNLLKSFSPQRQM